MREQALALPVAPTQVNFEEFLSDLAFPRRSWQGVSRGTAQMNSLWLVCSVPGHTVKIKKGLQELLEIRIQYCSLFMLVSFFLPPTPTPNLRLGWFGILFYPSSSHPQDSVLESLLTLFPPGAPRLLVQCGLPHPVPF